MPELHLTQPGFTYRTCGSFMKHLESIQKFKNTNDLKYIYKNELDKACFAYDVAYANIKDFA